jgi:hypothetical protein
MSYFRTVRTQAERRLVANANEQGVKVRARRNAANLPTEWDDKPHARRERCNRHKSHR